MTSQTHRVCTWVLPLFIFAMFCVSSPVLANASYESIEDSFIATFPTPPTRSVKFNPSPVGKIEAHRYVAQNDQGEFTVEVSQLPGIAIAFGSRKTIYRRAEKAFLKDTQSTKVSSQWQDVEGFAAHQLHFKTNAGEIGEAWFVLVGKRLYILMGKSYRNAAAVQTFLKSFRLIDPAA